MVNVINQGESITVRLHGAELTLSADEIVKGWLAKLQEAEHADHPDDIAVNLFAAAMRDKMAFARSNGRAGWNSHDICSDADLAKSLIAHIAKGDPVDVANFAMMLHQRRATPDALSTAIILHEQNTPRLGELWKCQGGIYAGLVRGTNGQPDHHLIVAPPGSIGHFSKAMIGTSGTTVATAIHRTDGMTNTKAFAEAGSEFCQQMLQLHIDGHRDWYLGADGEYHLAYCNVPELFDKEGWYITSTQGGAHYVRVQYFGGSSSRDYKSIGRRAVAVRRIQLSNSVPQ